MGDPTPSARGVDHLFVAERSRILYVRVPKAACTTLLWGLLEWEGHDPSIMDQSREPLLSTPSEVVHDMSIYPVPTLASVRPSLRHSALTDSDWLRLAVVRNPYARLYSAWESKLLVRPPGNRRFTKEGTSVVETAGGIDIGASFRAFVKSLAAAPEQWLSERHFQRQTDLVPIGDMTDIEMVPTTGIADLFVRLSDRTGVPVTARRSNEGLGIDGTTLLDQETAERISEIYSSDFDLTGADRSAFTLGEPVYLDAVAQRLLQLAAARSRRTVQLSRSFQHDRPRSAGRIRRGAGWRVRR